MKAFTDPNLEKIIRHAICQPAGELRASDLSLVTVLYADDSCLRSLDGIEQCCNLNW